MDNKRKSSGRPANRTSSSYKTKSSSTEKSSFRSEKPFKKREENDFSEKRSFSKDKPFNKSSSSERSSSRTEKPYKKREDSESTDKRNFGKPYVRKNDDVRSRPSRFKNNDSEREDKFSGEEKPYKSRSFSKPSRSFSGKPRFEKKPAAPKVDDGSTRLNKLIASSGICSRREADDMIVAGLVSVNGNIVTELGTKVMPDDDVRYNGERLRKERLVYILLNKPKDYITTLRDPHAKRTVLELIDGACKERVYPVGRLDRNTTGVLLLTNDGDLAKKLTHPSHNRKKIYQVQVDKNVKMADIEIMLKGIELEDGYIKADDVSFVDANDKKTVGVEIHSGKNRIVRRIFEHFGYTVEKLDRVYFAGLTKKSLQRGRWRFLTEQEIASLKMGSYE
jgi:23S rRNA pseudouridine2605 synthase